MFDRPLTLGYVFMTGDFIIFEYRRRTGKTRNTTWCPTRAECLHTDPICAVGIKIALIETYAVRAHASTLNSLQLG